MNGIVITEKNFSNVAARIVKFFNGADIVQWHSFDCGMKRHIPTDFISKDALTSKYVRFNCTRRYQNVSAVIGESIDGGKLIRIRLNKNDAVCLKIGDVVKFCGNRIHLKTPFILSDFKYLYEAFQILDSNGGFKDLEPEYDWDFDF